MTAARSLSPVETSPKTPEAPSPGEAFAAVAAELVALLPGNQRRTDRIDEASAAINVYHAHRPTRAEVAEALRLLDCDGPVDVRGSLQGVTYRWHAPVTVTVAYRA